MPKEEMVRELPGPQESPVRPKDEGAELEQWGLP